MKFKSSKIARYSPLLVITVLMVLSLIIAVPLVTGRPGYQVTNTSEAKITADLNDEQIPFDLLDFSNETVFNVTKRIIVNEWGYTIVNTTMSISNNGNSTFNYFDITVPLFEWEKYDHTLVTPSEIKTETPLIDNSAETVTWAFQTPDIEPSTNYTFSIVAGSNSLAYIRPGVEQSDTTFPIRFKVAALPWFSVPINNLEIQAEFVAPVAGATFDNTSIMMANNLTDETPEEIHSDHYKLSLTELDTIDFDSLSDSSNGGYDTDELSSQGIEAFIPAYTPSLASNMTSIVEIDYRDGDGRAIVHYTDVAVIVDIDQWGTTWFTETITIENTGPEGTEIFGFSNIGNIILYAPYDAIIDGVRDNHGNLSVTAVQQTANPVGFQDNLTKVTINSRVPVPVGNTYTFTLRYHLANDKVLDDLSGGKLALKSPLMTLFNWTISNYHLTVKFPYMTTVDLPIGNIMENNSQIGSDRGFMFFERPILTVEMENLTPFDNIGFEFTYGVFIGWFLIGPMMLSLFFLVLGLIYVSARLLSYRISPAIVMTSMEEIPYDLIGDYVKAYEEKTALRERIRQLTERRKRMKVKEYEKSIKIFDSKLAESERQLVHSMTELSKKGGRYRETSRSIQLAESEREDVLKNLQNLERRKKASRIDRETYVRLQRQYEKRLKKSNTTIDKVLIELRSLLTERKR
ncbi:MAG: hypothetical protein ACXAEU_19970 [Candidatus Hodarchaeales archaeon]|jgi:hypothetical protein